MKTGVEHQSVPFRAGAASPDLILSIPGNNGDSTDTRGVGANENRRARAASDRLEIYGRGTIRERIANYRRHLASTRDVYIAECARLSVAVNSAIADELDTEQGVFPMASVSLDEISLGLANRGKYGGVQPILDVLAVSKHMTRVSMRNCQLCDTDLRALFDCIPSMSSVSHVDVRGSDIKQPARLAAQVLKVVQQCPKIVFFAVDSCLESSELAYHLDWNARGRRISMKSLVSLQRFFIRHDKMLTGQCSARSIVETLEEGGNSNQLSIKVPLFVARIKNYYMKRPELPSPMSRFTLTRGISVANFGGSSMEADNNRRRSTSSQHSNGSTSKLSRGEARVDIKKTVSRARKVLRTGKSPQSLKERAANAIESFQNQRGNAPTGKPKSNPLADAEHSNSRSFGLPPLLSSLRRGDHSFQMTYPQKDATATSFAAVPPLYGDSKQSPQKDATATSFAAVPPLYGDSKQSPRDAVNQSFGGGGAKDNDMVSLGFLPSVVGKRAAARIGLHPTKPKLKPYDGVASKLMTALPVPAYTPPPVVSEKIVDPITFREIVIHAFPVAKPRYVDMLLDKLRRLIKKKSDDGKNDLTLEVMLRIFREADADGSGELEIEELLAIFGKSDEIRALISEFDQDGSNSISFDEFVQLLLPDVTV